MTQLPPLVIILIITLLFSCGRLSGKKRQEVSTKEIPALQSDSQRLKEIWRKMDEEDRTDSIRMSGVLKEAMEIAYANIKATTIKKEFVSRPDSLYTFKTKLEMNDFFSKGFKHLMVHISQPGDENAGVAYEYINIYLKEDDSFKLVVSYSQWEATYITDTLQDVNGDGMNDFLVNWYGSNGSWLKNFYDVYLYQPQTGTFSEGYEFINPTFSSKEKVIRGVEYGQPGETEMYKYKWNGLQVDTLEYIYFEKNDKGKNTGKVIRNRVLNNTGTRKEERLSQVPAEYRRIYGYEWFTGKF